jgi:hypothetical protein
MNYILIEPKPVSTIPYKELGSILYVQYHNGKVHQIVISGELDTKDIIFWSWAVEKDKTALSNVAIGESGVPFEMESIHVTQMTGCSGCKHFFPDEKRMTEDSKIKFRQTNDTKHCNSESVIYGVCGYFVQHAREARQYHCNGEFFNPRQTNEDS